ncbi:hypothetical protein K440DRAFT_610209 [Wilcoxina mikolae CBS 423.85]|nr:hypothetical protein K440DRAFT_610209 [Wilcoxina mikolae CBS 423.85]
MEFYNQPGPQTYLPDRLRWYEMPLENSVKSAKVIAVTSEEATYWTIAYTILLTSAFAAIAKLVTGLVLTYAQLRGRGNRHVMLVTFYNAGSPLTAATQMAQYAYEAVFHSRKGGAKKVNWDSLYFSVILASIAGLSIIIAQTATFLIGGKTLVARHAARANPAAIYYPEMIPSDIGDPRYQMVFELVQPVRAAAAYQALGRLEASKANVEKVVNISIVNGTSDNGTTFELQYNYAINGSDLGLQHATELVYSVRGGCRTEYNWLVTAGFNNSDTYPLWGNVNDTYLTNPTYATAKVDAESDNPPWLNIVPEWNATARSKANRGYEFAIVPNTSHRKSPVPNLDDPWYITEDNPEYVNASNSTRAQYQPYRVRRGRPPVLCWQNDTWSLGNNKVYNVVDLDKLPGLQLSTFLRDIVFQREFAAPPFIQTGNNLGYAMVSSAMDTLITTAAKTIYASRCNATRDIERLIQISFLASREVARNTVLLYPTLFGSSLKNGAVDANGQVPDEYADFIVESKDVAALRVKTMVSVPALCIFFWGIILIGGKMNYGVMKAKNVGARSRHNLRMIALQASQLYRLLDEEISGVRRWSGRTTMSPYIRDIELDDGDRDKVRVREAADTERADEPERSPVKFLPISVDGPGKEVDPGYESSPFIRPKLVQVPTPNENEKNQATTETTPIANPKPMLSALLDMVFFWRTHTNNEKTEKFELVMTRRWKRALKTDDKYADFNDIRNDVG